MLKGIDVSVWQGNIDWSQVASAVDFAILRGGYSNSKDLKFEEYYKQASQKKIPLGVYWYCYAHTTEAARAEAQACINALQGKKFTYPIFYDVEEQSIFAQGKQTVSSITEAFLSQLRVAGFKKLGVYSSAYPLSTYFNDDILKRYDVWVANYGVSAPAFSKPYTIWQYSSKGAVPGISGDVDMDYCYKDYTGSGTESKVVSFSEYAYNSSVVTVPVADLLDTSDIKSYIATFNRNTKEWNMDKLKELGVVGVLVEAGFLYDSAHLDGTFASPMMDAQIKACKAANLPYGLYMTARARNEAEVQAEMWWYARYIQKYIPEMGAWIVPAFTTAKSINDNLLDAYKSSLEHLGLRKKIGLYTTKAGLEKITWKNKCDDWYLWLEAHISSLDEIEGLLYPEFFMLDPATAKPREQVSTAQYVQAISNDASSTTVTVPASVNQSGITGNYTNYSYYYGRWATSSIQNQLANIWNTQGRPQRRNIAIISGNYLVAVSSKFGTTGDSITVYLQNGEKFDAIVADAKGADATSPWGHVLGSGQVDIIEWEKKGNQFTQVDNVTKIDLTGWQGQKVTKIVNHGRYKGLN